MCQCVALNAFTSNQNELIYYMCRKKNANLLKLFCILFFILNYFLFLFICAADWLQIQIVQIEQHSLKSVTVYILCFFSFFLQTHTELPIFCNSKFTRCCVQTELLWMHVVKEVNNKFIIYMRNSI